MVRRRYQPALLALLSYLCPLAEAAAYDCSKVVEDGIKFDLKPLGGPHSAYHLSKTSTGLVENTTFTLDLCSNLPFDEKTKNHCPMGTRVCAEKSIVKDIKKPEDAEVEDIWPIAGEYTGSLGRSLDPKWSRLKKSDSNADKDKEGLRLELNGGVHQLDKKPQKAIIELVCDHDQTGLDDNNAAKLRSLSAEDDDSGDGDEEEPEQPKGPLRVFGYSDEPSGKTVTSVLRLEWATKYACEDQAGKDEGQGSSSGWGFFTWFILILFLALAAYLIFGAWLNYNRYGARGWDLMPHGDTIRDVPYILKDWARRLTSSFATGGGRGGYSAI